MFILRRRLLIPYQLRLLELRVDVNRARVLCLKRGYFSGNVGNLTTNFWCRSVISNHAIECIKALLDGWHIVRMDLQGVYQANDDGQRRGTTDVRVAT